MNTENITHLSGEQVETEQKSINKEIGKAALRTRQEVADSIERAPEGYLTARALAEKIGINKKTVGNKIKELQVEGIEYKDKRGIICTFLSPEQQQQIKDSLDYLISADEAPEGYLTARAFASEIGVDKATVGSKIKELGIEGVEYKDKRGIICTFLSPEQQADVIESLNNRAKIGEQPEGYLSVYAFAEEIGLDGATVMKRVKQLNIEGTEYKDERGVVCTFLSPEQQQQIKDSLDYLISADEAPEGYLTARAFASEIGVDKATVGSKIKELGIEGTKYKSMRGAVYTFLSPEQQQQIKDSLDYLLEVKKVPNGYITADGLSKSLNTSWRLMNDQIRLLGIEGTEYKDERGVVCTFLSPEQQQQIKDSLDYLISADEAPEGYLTARAFASEIGVDKATVSSKIKELGIEGVEYKDKRGIICTFLSPGEQNDLRDYIEESFAGTSIPENAVAFYLDLAKNSIIQSLRPDWLKNPDTGRNLEVDVFVNPPGIGIEYDGCFYHQDVERDVKKDNIARQNGYHIIHIREDGCPEMPEGSYCIKRKNNNDDTDLGECIRKCFEMLDIPIPDIDVIRDKKDIMAFMRQRVLVKLDSARTFGELSVAF